MQVGSDQGREASSSTTDRGRGAGFVAAFDDALPMVHRYLFASTGGDAALAEDLTAATFEAAAQGWAVGGDEVLALGPLLDAARAVLAARVSPLARSVRRVRRPRGRGAAASGDDVADVLLRLPLGHRVVLALRYHDHLPVDEVARTVATDPAEAAAVLADALAALRRPDRGPAAGDGHDAGAGDGGADADGDGAGERLTRVYATLHAGPDDAWVAALRARLRAEVEAAGPTRRRAAPSRPGGGPRPAEPPTRRGPDPAVPTAVARPAPPAGPAPAATPAPLEGAVGGPIDAPTRPGRRPVGPTGRTASRHVVRPDTPGDVRSPGREHRDPAPEPVAIEIEGSGETGDRGLRPPRTPLDPLRARPDGGRVRRERSSRTWIGVGAVALLAVVGLAALGAGGDGGPRGSGGPAGEAATPGGGSPAGDSAAPPGTVPLRIVPPADDVGVEVPESTSEAEVVARAHLGPGGPYMNGPYAVAAGDEGLWATAVGDDGTWQAVRIDPVTGAALARVRIPGRVPSDRSHHGLALSGGYVWAPALRDGLFRIDASTNAPSGVVGVAGGVVGAALDGGDGAVWAVGNDSVLRRIDSRTTEVTAAAMIPEMGLVPNGVDLAYGGGTVWVSVGDNALRRLIGFDPVTLDRRYDYQVEPLGPLGDAYDIAADIDRVVIAEAPPGGVTVIDGAEGQVLASHQLQAAGIAVDGDRAWLLAPDDGRATVVWTRSGDLLASAGVPPGVTDLVSTAEGGVWGAVPSAGELVRLRFVG